MRKTILSILIMIAISQTPFAAEVDRSKLEWEKTEDVLALKHDGHIIWQFNTRDIDTKPCFHPLNTFNGATLTNWRPTTDHPWHRGAWYSFKIVDGRNYWEEDKQTGKPKSQTKIREKSFTTNPDFSARIDLEMEYTPTEEAAPVILENRQITISAPDEHGDYQITSTHRFTPQNDTVINKNWYGGFAVRLGAELKDWTFIKQLGDKFDRSQSKKMRESGIPPSAWMCFVEKSAGPTQGIAVFDAPENLNHPPPWACIPGMPYLNPVFFGNEDVKLAKDQPLELKYQILVFHKRDPAKYLADKFQQFSGKQP